MLNNNRQLQYFINECVGCVSCRMSAWHRILELCPTCCKMKYVLPEMKQQLLRMEHMLVCSRGTGVGINYLKYSAT